MDIPPEAAALIYGAFLSGRGTTYVDDLQFRSPARPCAYLRVAEVPSELDQCSVNNGKVETYRAKVKVFEYEDG